ncbi:MAG TPA: hypothetical protein ENJ28_02475, partial [Gammaproteobacteria bacterium]|nr:hypothetical protein [Gammaproteobacteria bacterium]
MERVFKHGNNPAQVNKGIIIWSAKSEYESAQISLYSSELVTINDAVVTKLTNVETGASLPTDTCEIRIPEYVYVEWNTKGTPHDEIDGNAPDWYPDPLLAFERIEFKGNRSIWLTCYISAGASAGAYQGDVHISINNESYILPIVINVWGFSLPDKSTIYSSTWLHPSQLVKQYGVRKYSDEYWRLIDLVADDMKRHRQNVIFTRLNLIKTIKQENGRYIFDFSDYEKWVKIFLGHGFQAIEAGPLFHPKAFHVVSEKSGKKINFSKHKLKEFLQSKDGRKFLAV